MHSFDSLIKDVRLVLDEHTADEATCVPAEASCNAIPSHVFSFPPINSAPISIGPHAGKGIVLRTNTAVELGGTSEGSCALILPTCDETLVHDKRVTLIGPDIPALCQGNLAGKNSASTAATTANAAAQNQAAPTPSSATTTIPFAQIILVAGRNLTDEDFFSLEQCQHIKDYIDGYLVRSSTGQVHSRVSYQLAEAGFTLPLLASALADMTRKACSAVSNVEVIFVTSSGELLKRLMPLRSAWIATSHDIRKARWMEKGIDIDCPAGGHCGSCSDKDTCDRVRAIARMRKEGRE